MQAIKAYAAVAKETASPRDLESLLLLKAAFKLQSVYDGWTDQPHGLDDAVLYNRRLWTVFLDSVCDEASLLPVTIRQHRCRITTYLIKPLLASQSRLRANDDVGDVRHAPAQFLL